MALLIGAPLGAAAVAEAHAQVEPDSAACAAEYAKWPHLNEEVFIEYDVTPPQVSGGLDALAAHLTYPASAVDSGSGGRVFLHFIVDTTGVATCLRVLGSAGADLDAAALAAIEQVEFVPAEANGERIRFPMSLPITFEPDR